MSLTIEQLKFAREIGATHTRMQGKLYKVLDGCVFCHSFGGWSACFEGFDIDEWMLELKQIDFSLLHGE